MDWAGREQTQQRGGRRKGIMGKEGSAQEGRDCSGTGAVGELLWMESRDSRC
jgi:hypothetical protein